MVTIMSAIGTPQVGESPGFQIESSVTEILYGAVMRLTATMEVAPVDGSNRDFIMGVSKQEFPLETNTAGIAYVSEATDIGPRTYDPAAGMYIAVEMEGVHWALVDIPAGGSNITITYGLDLVPCLQSGSTGCEAIAAAHAMATPNAAEINAALDEERRVFARALSNIHTDFNSSGFPALGQNAVNTLVNTAARDIGWVLVKLLN